MYMSQYFDNKDSFLQPKVTQYGSHMVMTNVQKETKIKYWNIDTKFRDDYQEYSKTVPTQYTVSLPEPITNVKSITVANAEIPLSFFNISASFGNNSMQIVGPTSTYVLIVRDGVYTSTSLKTEINYQLTQLSLNTTIFYDISGNGTNSTQYSCFTVSLSNTYTFNFAVKTDNTCSAVVNLPNGTNGITGITASFDKYYVKSKLGWLLGFRNITYRVTGTPVKTQYSENAIDLSNPRYLYLVVDEFTASNPNSFVSHLPTSLVNKNILAKITLHYQLYPLGSGSFLPANHSNGHLQSDCRTYTGKVDLQRLKIQLVNEYGSHINLNGSDFSFSLKIVYE